MAGGDTAANGFGTVLRRLRLAAGLTQEELAQTAGLSVRAVADIERGRTSRPYRRSVVLLADALGLSGQDLMAFTRAARSGSASGPMALPTPQTRQSAGWEPVVPRQLPAAVRGFAGRSGALSTLAGLADQAALSGLPAVITAITGIPGVGKTSLAVHWCHQIARRFPDGQLYLNLRGFDPSAAALSPTVALHDMLEALGLPPSRIPASREARGGLYRSVLAERAVLVLLDNAHDEAQIRPLLPAGPSCLTVITSRCPLTGLIADTGAHPIRLDVLTEPEAVELLAARLGAVRISQDLQAATELARLCAGLPLALSITAARVASRPGTAVAALADELRTAPHLLSPLDTGDPATSPEAAFSWSYSQLSPQAARMFRLLGVHPGREVSGAAGGALADIPADRVWPVFAELCRAGLIAALTAGRFGLHDLLRAYAAQLSALQDQPSERAHALDRILTWYLDNAAAASRILEPRRRHTHPEGSPTPIGPPAFASYDEALGWLETERPNLIVAVARANEAGAYQTSWQLAINLWDVCVRRGHWPDWIQSLRIGLASARAMGDQSAQGWLLNHLAIAYQQSADSANGIACFRQSLDIRRRIGDQLGEATVLGNLGRAYCDADLLPQALECLHSALAVCRQIDQPRVAGLILRHISATSRRAGDHDAALATAQQAVDILGPLRDREETSALTELAFAYIAAGHPRNAIQHAVKAAELSRAYGDRVDEAEALVVLGHARHACAQFARARRHWHDAYLVFSDLGDKRAAETLAMIRGQAAG